MVTDKGSQTEVDGVRPLSRVLALHAATIGVAYAALSILAAQSAEQAEADPQSPRLLAFSGVLLLHGIAYLTSPHLVRARATMLVYFFFQSVLLIILSAISSMQLMPILLYVALAGQAIALIPTRWPIIVIVAGSAAFLTVEPLQSYNDQIVRTIVVLSSIAMSVYVINSVRGLLARAEARELLDDLQLARTDLAQYATDVEEIAVSTERQRVARELHDTLLQGLVGVTLQLEAIDSHLASGGSNRAKSIVRHAMARARETLRDSRRAIEELRVHDGSNGDVAAAVRTDLERFSAATGVASELVIDLPDGLTREQAEHVQRILAEAFSNVARHAQATSVVVSLSAADGHCEILVRDDGLGFEPPKALQVPGHYGLLGIHERARAMGGNVTIDASPGKGTSLRVAFPTVARDARS